MPAFRGVGIIAIAPYSTGATFGARAFVDTGNNSQLQDSFNENREEQRNYRTIAGGVYASDVRIDSFQLNITGHDFSVDQFTRAIWGSNSTDAAGSVASEAHTLHFGKVMVLDHICDDAQSVTITVGATTFLEADYVVDGDLIYIAAAPTTSGVSDGDSCTVAYTKKAATVIELLTSTAPLVSIAFKGYNAIDGKAWSRKYWKCRLGAPSGIDGISDTMASLPIVATVLSDDTVTGTGLSKYGKFLVES